MTNEEALEILREGSVYNSLFPDALRVARKVLADQAEEKERIIRLLKSEFKKYYGDNWDKAPYLLNAIEIVKRGGIK